MLTTGDEGPVGWRALPGRDHYRWLKDLTPRGARLVLEWGEKLHLQWRPSVIHDLLDRAGIETLEEIKIERTDGVGVPSKIESVVLNEYWEGEKLYLVLPQAYTRPKPEVKRGYEQGASEGEGRRRRKRGS